MWAEEHVILWNADFSLLRVPPFCGSIPPPAPQPPIHTHTHAPLLFDSRRYIQDAMQKRLSWRASRRHCDSQIEGKEETKRSPLLPVYPYPKTTAAEDTVSDESGGLFGHTINPALSSTSFIKNCQWTSAVGLLRDALMIMLSASSPLLSCG